MRRRYIRFPWKRNLRKVPDWIEAKAQGFSENDLVAACVKKVSAAEVRAGKYAHLGIELQVDELSFPERLLPNAAAGKYSRRNVNGYTLVRKDLPKITKTYSMEVPNFGDWSRGSHTISMDRQVYRRDLVPPQKAEIEIELLEEESTDGRSFVFKFSLDKMMTRSDPGFLRELLVNLNLLQENVGTADVFPANATLSDYLSNVRVNWEILPPGERGPNMAKMLSGNRTPSLEARHRFEERYDLLEELKPVAFVNGTGGFSRYFGAKFADDLVVLEHIEYGNAIYVMFENWETLSQRSRTELLGGGTNGFVRIIHRPGWEPTLKALIAQRR